MKLGIPKIPVLEKYPQGADVAAIFAGGILTLTYWDLWCLITTKHRFNSNLTDLRTYLVNQRLNENFYSMHRRELLEDLIALVDDLTLRFKGLPSIDEVLSLIPEKLIKKETQKGIKNITDAWGTYYPPSEPMLRSPRRLLEFEALRGMWPKLPFNPEPIAAILLPLFIPKRKPGYFPKGQSFALSRRIDKAVQRELAKADSLVINRLAYQYSVYRAALALYHEENSWDDSYGVMGDMGQGWVKAILLITPDLVDIEPEIFLKDLLMFFCWEDYGLSRTEQISNYVNDLSPENRKMAVEVLTDIRTRAAQGFQTYHAENAEKILEKLTCPIAKLERKENRSHLSLVDNSPNQR